MKVFVLLSRFPYPLEKGDKLRVFNQIKELSKYHEIILCALSDEKVSSKNYEILKQYCVEIKIIRLYKLNIYFNLLIDLFLSKQSLQVSYFYNKRAHKKILNFINETTPNHIYCQLIRVTEYVKHLNIPKTLDYMDALARGMERRIEKAPFYLKPFLKIETTRLKRYEHEVFDYFENLTIISNQDRDLIVHLKNEKIKVIPNGVDYCTFKFKNKEKKYDLIFTGNMSYPPNVDSACYLVKEIMPKIWRKNSNISLAIVGANPDNKVLALKSTKVIVTGWVDDISDYYASSKIFIAPMQLGTGLQNKLLEAMAMKLPCITSSLANNALGATHNKNILIGDYPEHYAQHVVDLLENKEFYNQISNNGHQFVTQNYTWEGTTSILNELITKE